VTLGKIPTPVAAQTVPIWLGGGVCLTLTEFDRLWLSSFDQIAKLSHMAQALKNENTALKSHPDSPAHVSELGKKDEMISRLRQEVKK